MQTNSEMVQPGTDRDIKSKEPLPKKGITTIRWLPPFTFLLAMVCAILLLDAVLPLEGFWFHTACSQMVGHGRFFRLTCFFLVGALHLH